MSWRRPAWFAVESMSGPMAQLALGAWLIHATGLAAYGEWAQVLALLNLAALGAFAVTPGLALQVQTDPAAARGWLIAAVFVSLPLALAVLILVTAIAAPALGGAVLVALALHACTNALTLLAAAVLHGRGMQDRAALGTLALRMASALAVGAAAWTGMPLVGLVLVSASASVLQVLVLSAPLWRGRGMQDEVRTNPYPGDGRRTADRHLGGGDVRNDAPADRDFDEPSPGAARRNEGNHARTVAQVNRRADADHLAVSRHGSSGDASGDVPANRQAEADRLAADRHAGNDDPHIVAQADRRVDESHRTVDPDGGAHLRLHARIAVLLALARWQSLRSGGTLMFGAGDRVLVGHLLGPSALAVYSVCAMLAEPILRMAAILTQPLLLWAGRMRTRSLGLGAHARGFLAIEGTVLAVGMLAAVVAPWLLPLWLGEDAAQHVTLLRLAIAASTLAALHPVVSHVLTGSGRQRDLAWATLLGGAATLAAMASAAPAGLEAVVACRLLYGVVQFAGWPALLRLARGDPATAARRA